MKYIKWFFSQFLFVLTLFAGTLLTLGSILNQRGEVPSVAGMPDYSTETGTKQISWSFSKKYLVKYYPKAVLTHTTNTAYENEIKAQGSRVIIPTIPNIVGQKRSVGQETIWQRASSPPVEFNVNRAYEWAVKLDNISKAQMLDKTFLNKCANDAAEQAKLVIDTDYLSSIYLSAASYNQGNTAGYKTSMFTLGATNAPITLNKANITTYVLMCEAALNEADVPETGRFLILPTWARFLLDDSKIQDAAYTGLNKSDLVDRGGYITNIGRFRVYESNLYTSVSDNGKTCFNIIFGHEDATTSATQLVKTNYFDKFENDWAEGIKGLQVYDWMVIKGQALGVLYATMSTVF